MSEITNEDRASKAEQAVLTYANVSGGYDNLEAQECLEEAAADLICDLLHLADTLTGDTARAMWERAKGNYNAEVVGNWALYWTEPGNLIFRGRTPGTMETPWEDLFDRFPVQLKGWRDWEAKYEEGKAVLCEPDKNGFWELKFEGVQL